MQAFAGREQPLRSAHVLGVSGAEGSAFAACESVHPRFWVPHPRDVFVFVARVGLQESDLFVVISAHSIEASFRAKPIGATNLQSVIPSGARLSESP